MSSAPDNLTDQERALWEAEQAATSADEWRELRPNCGYGAISAVFQRDYDFCALARNSIRPLLEEISKLRYALLRANAGKLLEEIARLRGALMRIKNWRQEGQMVIFEDLVAIAREALEERKP